MTEQLPSWIKVEDALGDLTEIVPELETYVELAKHWPELKEAITEAPVDSPPALLLYLADRLESDPIVAIFKTLELEGLHGKLIKHTAFLTDPNKPWRQLLSPVDTLVEDYVPKKDKDDPYDDGDDKGLIALKIPKLAASGSTPVGKGELSFGIEANAGLELEAGSVWPRKSDKVDAGLLRIGAKGRAKAQAGFSFPLFNLGTGKAKASAEGKGRIDFFYRPQDPKIIFAEVAAKSLVALPNPLDLKGIEEAVQKKGMEGLSLAVYGAVSTGLGVTLGTEHSIKDLAKITAGLAAELNFARETRWMLSLRKDDKGLAFALGRLTTEEDSWSVGVDITVDYSGLARKVHEKLSKAHGLVSGPLDKIRPFLSPGTYLREQGLELLEETVSKIIEDEKLGAAILSDIGLVLGGDKATDLALADFLRTRISDLAAEFTGGIVGDATEWAKKLVGGLADSFPGLEEDALLDELMLKIKPLVDDVKGKFKETVADLGKTEEKALAKALSDAGIKLDKQLDKLNRLTEGVRELVEKFDKFSRDVLAELQDGTNHKLQARFGWSGKDTSGVEYELSGHFTKVNADTSALWRSLMKGDMQPFQRILADKEKAPAGVELHLDSRLARFAAKERGFALEIVIFGMEVSIASIVKGEAKVGTTVGGDIAVFAKGSADKITEGFTEGRKASFISTYDLVLRKLAPEVAPSSRTMSVDVKLTHEDNDLKPKEVSGFIGGLNQLIDPTRAQAVEKTYQGWENVNGKVKGQLDVSMALTDQALARILALGRLADDGSEAHRKLFDLAVSALKASGALKKDDIEDFADRVRRKAYVFGEDFDKYIAKIDGDDAVIYSLRNTPLERDELGVQEDPIEDARKLSVLAASFPNLLWRLSEIYDAIPTLSGNEAGKWSEKRYRDEEFALADDARRWLQLNREFVFWFKHGIHPTTLAFLHLLANMDRKLEKGEDPLATLDGKVGIEASNALFAITGKSSEGKLQKL